MLITLQKGYVGPTSPELKFRNY